ncbi:MAG: exosortase A [Nitrospirota bacterium]
MKDVTLIPLRQVPMGRPTFPERQAAGLMLLSATLCVVAMFWPTILSMVDVWLSSRTFAHGFLVLPVVGYLVWSSRRRLVGLTPHPSVWGLVALLLSGSGWIAGALSGLVWLQQAAVVAVLPGLVWTIYGTEIVRTLSWPLGFLIFLLPVGTSLEPWLQDVTAWLILRGLDLSGIAYMYRDYHIIVGPANWEVAPDCAGLRYLLPGLSLGYAFAALIYRQPARRIVFLVFCAVALMVANGIRAYGVIVGNHLGIAAGADHRIFSYTIYGLTMPCLFWLGLKWKQRVAPDANLHPGAIHRLDTRKAVVMSFCGVGLLLLARFALWFFPASS